VFEPVSLGAPATVSQSPLWSLLEGWFQSEGVAAWDEQVPYFITNSAAAAQIYAELILAFVRDLGPDPEGRPLTILELGTGLGRLGFLLCRELERQRPFFAATRAQPIRLILSDIAKDNLRFWESHPALAPYRAAGSLDFACYNPLRDDVIRLEGSGEVLGPGSLDGPLVVIANYVLCNLPHDEFLIRDHKLQECRIELFQLEPKFSTADRVDIRDVTGRRTYHDPTPYANAAWNGWLDDYGRELAEGAVTLPVGGLTCLERLRGFSRRGLMLLASDRGYTSPQSMAARERHDPDLHQGGFSFMVNLHALGRHFEHGLYLCTTHASSEGVHTLVGAALADKPPLENLQFTFREHLDRVNRINASSLALPLVREGTSPLERARALVAFLQLNLGDPFAVTVCMRSLSEFASNLRGADRRDLLELLADSEEKFYAFPGACKLPHALAHLYFRMGCHEQALPCYDRALAASGHEASLHLFRAVCLQRLGRREEARLGKARAVELDPSLADMDLDFAV